MELPNHTENWGIKRSGSFSYSTTLAPAFIPQQRDAKLVEAKIKDTETLFDQRKIGTLKHLANLGLILLGEADPIKRRIEAIKLEGGEPRVLDLMGYGSVIRKLDVGGMAVAVSDIRNQEERQYDESRDVEFVNGSVISSKTWQKIRKNAEAKGGFDLILCRPAGAIKNVPKRQMVYSALVNQMYGVLDNNGGTLLTEFHTGMRDVVDGFIYKLRDLKVHGIQARTYMGAFSLVRNNGSPNSLPPGLFELTSK